MSEAVSGDKLPLVLSRLTTNKPPSNRLPFALNRPLGQKVDVAVTPTDPIKPAEPAQKRRMRWVGGALDIQWQGKRDVAHGVNGMTVGQLVAKELTGDYSRLCLVVRCQRPHVTPFIPQTACYGGMSKASIALARCEPLTISLAHGLKSAVFLPLTTTIKRQGCVGIFGASVQFLHTKATPYIQATDTHHTCQRHVFGSTANFTCQFVKVNASVPVPCRYYPVPKPPPPPPVRACRVRPPSSRLPLILTRKSHTKQDLDSRALPFAFICWHDTNAVTTPNKRAYLMHNTISATIGGIAIEPLAFSIKTDMDSFCWQGQIEMTAKDYTKIKAKLDVARGNEPVMTVSINGHAFAIIAEEQSTTRQFIGNTHTLSGRSVTARLSADYAGGVDEMSVQALYASQMVAGALDDLPYTHEMLSADWLIPAGTYSTSDKTPIAIISDMAAACGAFVASDTSQAHLTIKPRYKVPAWAMGSTNPDIIIALDVIRQLNQQKQINPRHNTIILTSEQQGAIVYREREGRDKEAPSQYNALYTDQACIIPAGIAALSDSGTHEHATLTLMWADKYNLPLAKLGDVWQVNDDEPWRGVVQSVMIDVKMEDGVPMVWQTVGLDRYLDV